MFSQGDKGTSWYIIWKGSINVITHGKVHFVGAKITGVNLVTGYKYWVLHANRAW